MRRALPPIMCAVLANLAAACTSSTSATDLHPEGPPMIEQVRIIELFSVAGVNNLTRPVFGFGTHPMASADDEHAVTTAQADGNKLRIIMDELLRGNNLEEIECRSIIDNDVFGRVPLGATPDDIARCTAAQDVLPSRCPGSNRLSVCLCNNDGGCPGEAKSDGSPSIITPKGESVGVKDKNQDGAADNTRFIEGAVRILCGANDIPIDLDASYWTPSGNQQKPAQGGFDALGPAVVLVPGGSLATSMECGVVFSPEVVDKDGNQVCAPPDGDIAAGCTPGDTSAIKFTVEPLRWRVTSSTVDQGHSRTDDVTIKANADIDLASIANITVTEGTATSYTQFTATLSPQPTPSLVTIHWAVNGLRVDLAPSTRYTITVPQTVTDVYQQSAPQPFQFAFTTSAN